VTSASLDIGEGSWVDHWLPAPLRPYARLARWDRPIGTWLLLFPCWWSAVLASPAIPFLHLFLFAIGAWAMRGAGCTINDMIDRDIDRQVARTAKRPLASGALGLGQALIFCGVQCAIGLAVALLFHNRAVVLWALGSMSLVVIYPAMKRFTWWPQFFLGLAFNWGALLGWIAERGILDMPAFLLYAGGTLWTLHYDTIYAHQDKADDRRIGVKSSALRLGSGTKVALALFSAGAVLCWGLACFVAHSGPAVYAALLGVALHCAWQIRALDIDDPAKCQALFRSNRWVGWIFLAGLVLDRIAPSLS
jgi:4-hydroxybenzoate polyprenyltransferase